MSLEKLSESIISRNLTEHLDDNKYLHGLAFSFLALLTV